MKSVARFLPSEVSVNARSSLRAGIATVGLVCNTSARGLAQVLLVFAFRDVGAPEVHMEVVGVQVPVEAFDLAPGQFLELLRGFLPRLYEIDGLECFRHGL